MDDLDIAKDRADWLLDAIAGATQNRQFLRGDPAYDEVAGKAILLNGEKAINVALSKKDAEITRLRAALVDAHSVGFAAGVEAAAKRVGFTECPACGGEGWEIYDHEEHDCQTCFGRGVVPHLDKSALTPPDATAAAARVLLPGMEQRHIDHITSLGRDPEKYTSEYSMVAKTLRAIAGDTP